LSLPAGQAGLSIPMAIGMKTKVPIAIGITMVNDCFQNKNNLPDRQAGRRRNRTLWTNIN